MLPVYRFFYIETPLLLFKLKLIIFLFLYPTLFVRQTATILQALALTGPFVTYKLGRGGGGRQMPPPKKKPAKKSKTINGSKALSFVFV